MAASDRHAGEMTNRELDDLALPRVGTCPRCYGRTVNGLCDDRECHGIRLAEARVRVVRKHRRQARRLKGIRGSNR